jgi:hypothetical protein
MLPHSDRRQNALAPRRWANSGPPRRGRAKKPAGFVATLAGATKPLLRATSFHRAP